MSEKESTGTNSMTTNDEQDLLISGDDLNEGQDQEQEPQARPERDEFDELLDDDPQTREAVKAEMRRRLAQPQQPPAPQSQEPSELKKVQDEIDTVETELESFFSTPEQERNYEQFERLKIRKGRLERQERQLERHEQDRERRMARAPQVIDAWIREQAATDREITKYADKIKQIARGLRPHILADEQTLRQALEYMVEPNAYKQYVRSRRTQQRSQPQDRNAPRDSYSDDDGDDRPRNRDRFADASDEEREFLRNVGVLKDRQKEARRSGLVPTGDGGYYIPMNGNKRREGGQS